MATRQNIKDYDPVRDIALELTKVAISAGALQRSSSASASAADKAADDALYITRLMRNIQLRLRDAMEKDK